MEVVELSEMIAVAFLAGCGVLMLWRRRAEPAADPQGVAVSPAALMTAVFTGMLVLELLVLHHR